MLGTAIFWVITQRVVVISCRTFGTTYRSHLQRSRIQKDLDFETTYRSHLQRSKIQKDLDFGTTYRSHLQRPRNQKDMDFGKTYRSHLKRPRIQKDLDFVISYRRFEKPIGHSFRDRESKSNLFKFLTPEDGTDRLSRNVGKELPLLAA